MPVTTDGLTNSKILETNKSLLTPIQKQVQFLMQQHLQRKGCPNCGEPHNVPEAAGVADVDDYDFGAHHDDRMGKCRKCKRTLIFVLPLMGDWHWVLDPAEAKVE